LKHHVDIEANLGNRVWSCVQHPCCTHYQETDAQIADDRSYTWAVCRWSNITTFKAAVRQAWSESITPEYCRSLFAGAATQPVAGAATLGWGSSARQA
jgi:hypothetical protein